MKAVMLSIQPKWCELIASGKKTVEVRKTIPKIPTPFKCYIYETKDFKDGEKYGFKTWARRGRVIGEFVCDRIDTMIGLLSNTHTPSDKEEVEKATCLTVQEITEYLKPKNGGFGMGYGWHISDLKIYDKPRELGEFRKPCASCGLGYSKYLARYMGCWDNCRKHITRPPQSWCYVEVAQ